MAKGSKKIFLGILAALSMGMSFTASAADDCSGFLALRQKDIVLKPGEPQVFLYDFRDAACLSVALRGLWAYIADPMAPVAGCTNRVNLQTKVKMELTDLTSGVVGTPAGRGNTSVILNDPNPTPEGYYMWGSYLVTGHLVELKITLDPGVSKCLNANLRYAFSMSGL